MMKKVYQLNSELYKLTGIQKVLVDIHDALKDELGAKIVGTVPFDGIAPGVDIRESDYIRLGSMKSFSSWKIFRNSVVIIHERKFLPVFKFLNAVMRLNAEVVYIHHNLMYDKKLLSLFPPHVVAIADKGIENLTDYFGVPRRNITKIHNCVREKENAHYARREFDPERVTLLYPARINSSKRQIEIVRRLRGRLDPRVRILFAGIGPDYDEFVRMIGDDAQFVALGFRNDILELLQQSDFMLLFSEHEGLPISIIEAIMSGTPVICNSVGGNPEIIDAGENGYMVDEWEDLIGLLNSLPDKDPAELRKMGEAGRRKYIKEFTFPTFKKNYLNYITDLAND